LSLKKVQILTIDEADKLFELNFEEQLTFILRSCPPSRQVLLFSATIPQQLAQFMKIGIREYKFIGLDEESKIPEKLKIHMIKCRSEDKKYCLLAMLKRVIDTRRESTMVFVPTKYHCEFLNEFLKFWGLQTLFIYGQMDMELRTKNLEKFKNGQCKICIVTDVAARGLDIPFLDNVINYDFPDTVKLFIHRVGRTARNDKEGRVISILSPPEVAFFFDFKPSLGRKLILNYLDEEEKVDKEMLRKALEDFGTISLGAIPNSIITDLRESKVEHLNNKIDIDELEVSASRAYNKSLLFKQKPSSYGIKEAKALASSEVVHPFFIGKLQSDDEIAKQNFLNQIKNYKPKENYFERVNETYVKEDVIKDFKIKAEEYKRRKAIDKRKEKIARAEMDNQIDEQDDEDPSTKKHEFLGKKQKRSQIKNFKNNPHYVSDKQEKDKSLWGDEKPISLDELTLNIVPDDENKLHKQKKLVWDPRKKNFVKGNVDRQGKLVRQNEAGKAIKKGDKDPKLFQRWKKKNQMKSIPKVGELENDKLVNQASNAFKERKFAKRTGKKGPESEVKSFDQILKVKKDEFKKNNRKSFSKRDAKERFIKGSAHLNRRSQAMVKKRGTRGTPRGRKK
jgi:ATP-dependent RNA helicase DDX54/DBP10